MTTLQPQGKDPGQRDTTKNHGRLGGIRQTPGYLQKQPCHLPEETGVQLLCAEKMTRETSQAVERRPEQILERHDMAEDSTRQGHLETTC